MMQRHSGQGDESQFVFSMPVSELAAALRELNIIRDPAPTAVVPAAPPPPEPDPAPELQGIRARTRSGRGYHGRLVPETTPAAAVAATGRRQPQLPPREEVDFCCKIKRVFSPHPLYCGCGAAIGPYANYRRTKGPINGVTHFVCERCFNGPGNSSRSVYISESITLKKSEFTRIKNDKVIAEPITSCRGCGEKFHSVCVTRIHNLWPEYYCTSCLTAANLPPLPNPYRASDLPLTELCANLETNLRAFLTQNGIPNKVWIRSISSETGGVNLGPNMAKRYQLSSNSYPYRNKIIFAFEEIDGVDVAFFAFIVQEYYSDCPPPNRGRIYLSYLDSDHLFEPANLRTPVYQRILLSYFTFVKCLGFEFIHIWACPPGPTTGGNYIFYNHPHAMKIPNHTRLQGWYKKLLARGVEVGVVLNYSDLVGHAASQLVACAKDMAYFDGDHWPDFFEETIQQEEKNRKAQEEAEYGPPPRKKSKKKGGKNKNNPNDEYPPTLRVDGIMHRTVTEMYLHGGMFLVAQLNEPNPTRIIQDPDTLAVSITLNPPKNDELTSRDILLNLMRRHNYEFCSLRKAKYATAGLLYELNVSNYVHCDGCGIRVGKDWYVCATCPGYDLCLKCQESSYHPHPLVLHSTKPKRDPPPLQAPIRPQPGSPLPTLITGNEVLTKEERDIVVQALRHAPLCHCAVLSPICTFGAELRQHSMVCHTINNGCSLCAALFDFVKIHFTECTDGSCTLPMCTVWNGWTRTAP